MKALPQKCTGYRRTKRHSVPRKVIRMGMRNERRILCIPRIQPEIDLREINSTVKNYFDHNSNLTARHKSAITASC